MFCPLRIGDMNKKIIATMLLALLLLDTVGAKSKKDKNEETQKQLLELMNDDSLTEKSHYAVMKKIAGNLRAKKDYQTLIVFLTDYVERNPDDMYNAYWLLMAAYTYLEDGAEKMAEYYFDRIVKNYNDLMIKDDTGKEQSVHFLCLQHLIQISKTPRNRILYFNALINRFPSDVNITELYSRLGKEYEKEGDFEQALKAYQLFLSQDDASTIRIAGDPDAYSYAKQLIDFSNSKKDWTFDTLEALESAVKKALSTYNPKMLDSYKSKVNFFAMSWKQDENSANAMENFSMRSFMHGNRIHFSDELDSSSTPNEAYLRTWGWSVYINVWYLYFRKVNFPADPEIHGRWEWAGIYFGEKL